MLSDDAVSKTGPVYHYTMLADMLTPVSAYFRIAEASQRAFLLESVEGGEKIGRYSFLGVDPDQSFRGKLDDFRKTFPPLQPAHESLPPFTGGAVGLFSYEMVRELESLPALHKGTSPDSSSVAMDFYPTILAFDHLKHQIVIMSREGPEQVVDLFQRLQNERGGRARRPSPVDSESHTSFTKDQFCAAVAQAKQHIVAGDIFQVVLSQRFDVPLKARPFDVYRALRFINPSPYLFFLKQDEVHVAGSSPEMLLRVNQRELSYRPIAGTRRRGRTPEEEATLTAELLHDEKERAEHLMLVDLGRNDLGRVSDYGTVSVEELMFVEKYSHVMHMVTSLKGKLRQDLDRFDGLAACFPAGTVTGAPKIRAMEIIEQLEPCHRGVYAGAIGYLDYSGNLDSCIAIRTIVMRGGRALLQAGAGIVADSVPEMEFKECGNKARVLFQALEMAADLE